MNDKERILMEVLNRLSLTQTLCLRGDTETKFKNPSDGYEYVHFGAYDDRPVKKGDLVLACTGNVSDWKVGWVHEVVSRDTCVIREIGSNRLCNYSNERFTRIVGMPEESIYEGDEYIFQQKVMRAFGKGDEYFYRYGGVDFLENRTARIWIREVFGGMIHGGSVPFSCDMKWDKRTSVKKILETMRENGYGTRKFDVVKKEGEETAKT